MHCTMIRELKTSGAIAQGQSNIIDHLFAVQLPVELTNSPKSVDLCVYSLHVVCTVVYINCINIVVKIPLTKM